MHLLHCVPQLDSKSTQYIPLPRITFRICPRLHLLIINNAHPKGFLPLDLSNVNRAFLISVRSCCQFARVPDAVEYIFGLEIPEGRELQPFADVVFELLDFMFDQGEGAIEGVVWETGQLKETSEQVCVLRTTLTYK